MKSKSSVKSLRKQYYLSASGIISLQERMTELEAKKSENIDRLKMLKEQQSDGVSLEDSTYIQTLSTMQFIETEIRNIRYVLSNATAILKKGKHADQVGIGSCVRLEGAGKQLEYTIVNSIEADPFSGKISDQSPLGQQLLGKKLQDNIIIGAPRRPLSLTLVNIN